MRRQKTLVPQLLAFGATDVYAADRVRCRRRWSPRRGTENVTIHNEPTLTERVLRQHPTPNDTECADRRASKAPVICTQGKVIPI